MVFNKLPVFRITTALMLLSSTLTFSAILTTAVADDVTIGDISARLDDLEKRVRGENPAGDEIATKEEVNKLVDLVKALTGRVEMLEIRATHKESGNADKHYQKEDSIKKFVTVDTDPDTTPSDISLDDAEIQDLLENLGKTPSPKETAKAKKEAQRDKATEEAEKTAPSLETGSPAKQFDQAKSLFNKKQYAEAENALEYYLETYPKGKEVTAARVRLGESQLEQALAGDHKKADKAAATFAKAYKANPKGTEGARALLGLAQSMAFKDKKKACTVLKKLQSDFPKNAFTSDKAASLNKKYKCS